MFDHVEFWAQRTVSPVDGSVGWTVVDDAYVEHGHAGAWLRSLLDAQGRSVGTARTYAGRLALYLTWATSTGVDPVAPTVEQPPQLQPHRAGVAATDRCVGYVHDSEHA